MAFSPDHFAQRIDKNHVLNLNERFKQYAECVRNVREQSKKMENHTLTANVQILQNEIAEMKTIYENELENQRGQLEAMTSERNHFHFEANKNGASTKELSDKYNDESLTRKKLENALADGHRLLSEKDSLIQELRITIAQHQNAHLDTSKEKDNIHEQLSIITVQCENEIKLRNDCEAKLQKLSDQKSFDQDCFERTRIEMQNQINAAERAIEIADEKLREQDIVVEKFQQQIANIQKQTQFEFFQYQEESEKSYQIQLNEHKAQLEREIKAHSQRNEENISLKAAIEELSAKIVKMDSKCNSIQDQNQQLIHTLEMERKDACAKIEKLEQNLRDMQESFNQKCRELIQTYNANIPLDMELKALLETLAAEEQRLKLSLLNPPCELVQTARGELVPVGRSQPGSPRRPFTSAKPLQPITRKSPSNVIGTTTEPPQLTADGNNKYSLPDTCCKGQPSHQSGRGYYGYDK